MDKSTDELFKEAVQRLGEIFTEDELIDELNKIPGFWQRRADEQLAEEMETTTNH